MTFRWGFVLPLAFAQLVSWGSLYYAFSNAVLWRSRWDGQAPRSMARYPPTCSHGPPSFFAGRIIDAYGRRVLMTRDRLPPRCAAGLVAGDGSGLYAVWIAMGVVFSCVLYEPVFAVMARELKDDYRRGIITITLLGGLASTAFIPLTQFLVDVSDWRQALVVLAAIQVPFGILVHWFVLRGPTEMAAVTKAVVSAGRVRKALVTPVFWLLALSYGAHAFMFTGLTFHIIPLLTERGLRSQVITFAGGAISGDRAHCGFALEKRPT
jgi:MFS family permease